MSKHYTPKQVCERLGVGIDLTLGLIHDGTLKASNVSRASTRPRWVIAEIDLQAFLDARSNQHRAGAKPAKRRIQKPKKEYV